MRYFIMTVLLLLAAYLATGVFQVQPWDRAVVRRFGRVLSDKPGPGFHIGLPWGIDRVDRVSVDRPQSITFGHSGREGEADSYTLPAGQLLTGDQNLVNVQIVIKYTVGNRDEDLENYILQAECVNDLVTRVAGTILSEWVASHQVDHILLRGKAELPAWLKEHTQEEIAPYQLGIHIQEASVAELAPPLDVKPAFENVTRAETDKEKRIEQARRTAANRLSDAATSSYRIKQEAASAEIEAHNLAEADASRFLERLEANGDALRMNRKEALSRIWWSEMRPLFQTLKATGGLQLLDHYLTSDGLDLTTFTPLPKK